MAVPRKKPSMVPHGGQGKNRIIPDIVQAAKKNSLRGVEQALAEDPSCVNAIDPKTEMSALHWACANRNLAIFNVLMAHPAVQTDKASFAGKTPAQLALDSGSPHMSDEIHKRVHYEDHLPDDPFDEKTNVTPFDPSEP